MRCNMFFVLLLMMAAFILPSEAKAVVAELVYDPTVDADMVETFSYFESEIMDLEKQLTDLDKALKVLTKYLWSDTSSLMNQLEKVMNQANALSYAAKNESAQFNQLFPGYVPLDNFNEQYQKITKSTLDTLNNAIQSLGLSANDFLGENNHIKQLQSYAEKVEGQTQAAQAAIELASEQISQLQLLRQAVMTEANAQAVYFAGQIQKEAGALAEFNTIVGHGDAKTTGILNTYPLERPHYE